MEEMRKLFAIGDQLNSYPLSPPWRLEGGPKSSNPLNAWLAPLATNAPPPRVTLLA